MSAPTVSVLVTAYNRERYIAAAIESVLAQWYQDFEIIVVDDRSTDGTLAIAEEYARRDQRIRVFQNAHNLGDYPNRNRAASHARGRYLKYHDSDDVMYPHCLQVMVSVLEAVPDAAFGLSDGRAWAGGGVGLLSSPRQSYHPDQERVGPRAADAYSRVVGHQWRALASPECPLDQTERALARGNLLWVLARLVRRDLRAGRWRLAVSRVLRSGTGLRDWFRDFRPARRTATAGTKELHMTITTEKRHHVY